MSHPEKLLFTFTSMFGNDYYGEGHDYLCGTKASLVHTQSDQVRVVPQGAKSAAGPGPEDGGYKEFTDRHMRNFFDCVRSRSEPVCPFELGFRTAISGGLGPAHALVGGHSRRVLPLRPGDRSRRPRSDRDVAAAPLCGRGPHGQAASRPAPARLTAPGRCAWQGFPPDHVPGKFLDDVATAPLPVAGAR